MPDNFVIHVREFSETPFGRYRGEGPESGEVFREDVLKPALEVHQRIIVNIDDVEGLPSSFLEEVMGGLVRDGYSVADLRKRIEWTTTQSDLKFYMRLAWRYAEEQEAKLKAH